MATIGKLVTRPFRALFGTDARRAPLSVVNPGSSSLEKPKPEKRDEVGMTAEVLDLYRDDPGEPWGKRTPRRIAKSTAVLASQKPALIVRREKEIAEAGDYTLVLHSIKVQSPLIRTALETVFHRYKGIDTNLEKLKFAAPFHEFFYRWTEFVNARPPDDDANRLARVHFDLLFDIIRAEISPHLEQASDLIKNGVVSYNYLWALFEPDSEVYTSINGHDQLCQLVEGRYVSQPAAYELTCRFIDTDGEKFGFSTVKLKIPKFANLKSIADLDILPSDLHADVHKIRAKLLDRGRKYETLGGSHYRAYSGTYQLQNPDVGVHPTQHTERSRVIVDCKSFRRFNGQSDDKIQSLKSSLDSSPHTSGSLGVGEEALTPPHILALKRRVRETRSRIARDEPKDDNLGHSLTSQQHILCSPVVKGYCFKTKKWAIFYIDGVESITWNETAFDKVVLPHDYKTIVWAFVDAQLARDHNSFDDIIEGKGKGMVMLLSGEPGTGKTLTSETIAEAMKKPLYSMSAGELGLAADEVEQNLSKVLELANKWNAVLLLDECDVFLEKRSASDLHRNKLVSVFLRLLEYYQGVMFLTTNRASSFDPAFESRIDLTLHYPALDAASRLHVWRTFVKPGSDMASVTEFELKSLAEVDLNGRQIKNVVKTALLLASRDKTPLKIGHIETVLKVKRGGSEALEGTPAST